MGIEAPLIFGAIIFGCVMTWAIIKETNYHKKDSKAAEVLEEGIDKIKREFAASNHVYAYEGFRLGEVTRHFDVNTSASIHGYITHNMGVHGWGIGMANDQIGLGFGKIGISGVSEVSLVSSGTNRDNLTGDGFIAVLERNYGNRIDTLRMVVPSENATREWMERFIYQTASAFALKTKGGEIIPGRNGKLIPDPKYRRCYSVYMKKIPSFLGFKDEASYVSDRLYSILRMTPESRPPITVYGLPLSEYAVIGTSIRFGYEEQLLPLFPIGLIISISQVVAQTVAILKE